MNRHVSAGVEADRDLFQALASAFDTTEQSLQRRLAEAVAKAELLQPLGARVAELETELQAGTERLQQVLAQMVAEREASTRNLSAAEAAAEQASTTSAELERLQGELTQSRLAQAELVQALEAAAARAEQSASRLASIQSEHSALSQRLDASAELHARDRSEWQQVIAGLRDALDTQRLALADSAHHAAALGQALQTATSERTAMVATLRTQLDETQAAARLELAAWRQLHELATSEWKTLLDAQQARNAAIESSARDRDEQARFTIESLTARVTEQAERAEQLHAAHQRQLAELAQERDLLWSRCRGLEDDARDARQALQRAQQEWLASSEQRQAEMAQMMDEAAAKQAATDAEAARLSRELQIVTATLAGRDAEMQRERAGSLSQRLSAARAADRAAARRRRLMQAALRRRALLRQAREVLALIASATPWYAGARARTAAASFQGAIRSGPRPSSTDVGPAAPQEVKVMSPQHTASKLGSEPANALVPSLSHLLTLHDEDFVRMAYRAVLGREADVSGLANYLGQLRQGADRDQILCELALSEEGRAVADRPAGLEDLLRHPRRRLSALTRVVEVLLRPALRPLMSRMNALDNHIGARHQDMDRRLRAIETQLMHANTDVARRLDGVIRSLQGLTEIVARLGAAAPAQMRDAAPASAGSTAGAASPDVDVLMENVRAELTRIRLR